MSDISFLVLGFASAMLAFSIGAEYGPGAVEREWQKKLRQNVCSLRVTFSKFVRLRVYDFIPYLSSYKTGFFCPLE